MKRIVLFFVIYVCVSFLHARDALESVQEIHKNVGNSLLKIRKHYPESQQQVYATIDQVSKLCDISKKQHSKKKSFKIALGEERKKNQEMIEKVERVAHKIVALQEQVLEKDRKIASLLQHESSPVIAMMPSSASPTNVAFVGTPDVLTEEKVEKVESSKATEKKSEASSPSK